MTPGYLRVTALAGALALLACGRTHRGGGSPFDEPGGNLTGGAVPGDNLAGGDSHGADAGPSGDPHGAGADANPSGDSDAAGDPGLGGGEGSSNPGDTSDGDANGGDGSVSTDLDPPGADSDVGGGVYVEINYRYRSPGESTSTGDWSFGTAGGYDASLWAPQGASWPYIHTPDGGALTSDPIGGTVLELGCNDRFRLFFGLPNLAFSSATVTVEGRSRATSSGVDFEVWNPGGTSGLWAEGSMSQDWDVDIVELAFAAEAGDSFQAVEIAPIARSCSLAIRRVRLTLFGL